MYLQFLYDYFLLKIGDFFLILNFMQLEFPVMKKSLK